MAHMGQCDQIFAFIAVVSNEREDFGGDLVYWYESVLRGPDEAQQFQSIPFEKVNLIVCGGSFRIELFQIGDEASLRRSQVHLRNVSLNLTLLDFLLGCEPVPHGNIQSAADRITKVFAYKSGP